MSLVLAAVGAVVAAVLDASIALHLRVGPAQPDFVLIFAIVWTMVVGVGGGLVWAFLGGLMLDILGLRPVGTTPFVLILAVGGAAIVARLVPRWRVIPPVVVVFAASVLYPQLFRVLYGAVRGPIPSTDPLSLVIPDAIYNTVLAAVISPVVVALHRRRLDRERADW